MNRRHTLQSLALYGALAIALVPSVLRATNAEWHLLATDWNVYPPDVAVMAGPMSGPECIEAAEALPHDPARLISCEIAD